MLTWIYPVGADEKRSRRLFPYGAGSDSRHRDTLDGNGRHERPVDFAWDEDRPFITHSSKRFTPLPLRTAAIARPLP